MARIRTVKPEFFRHEGLQDLETTNPGKHVMLTFVGLWGHCDKSGVFEWRPRTLKLDILPFLAFDMAETMAVLETAGMIRKFTVNGKDYGHIDSFQTHQRIGGKEAQDESKYPPPPTGEATGKQRGSNGEALGIAGREGKGREEEGNGYDARAREMPQLPPDFTADWIEATYPATAHGRNAVAAWHRASGLVGMERTTAADLKRRLLGFRAFVDSGGYTDPSKVPSMRTWFDANGESPHWTREWGPKPTKAQQQQDANIEASKAWLRGEHGLA